MFINKTSFTNVFKLLGASILAGLLGACGGSSGDEFKQGQFVDSPVSGLQYRGVEDSGIFGRTDQSGFFNYVEGQSVSFHLGGINLGQARGQRLVTPSQLGLSDQVSLNIIRCLLTLDADLNGDNGIEISAQVLNLAADTTANPDDFGSDFTLRMADFCENANSDDRSLVTETAALEHFQCTLNDIQDGSYDGDCGGAGSGSGDGSGSDGGGGAGVGNDDGGAGAGDGGAGGGGGSGGGSGDGAGDGGNGDGSGGDGGGGGDTGGGGDSSGGDSGGGDGSDDGDGGGNVNTGPVDQSSFDTSSIAEEVAISGSTIYVFEVDLGKLQAFDITSPNAPVLLGETFGNGADFASEYNDLAVSGTTAYEINQGVLNVYDFSDPTLPTQVGTLEAPNVVDGGEWNAIAVSGSTLYLSYREDQTDPDALPGFAVVDASNPTSPFIVGTMETEELASDIAVSGATVFLATSLVNTYQSVDVSNPANPQLLDTFGLPLIFPQIAVQGSYLYSASQSFDEMQIYNISNPSQVTLVGSVAWKSADNALDFPVDIAVLGSRVYITDNYDKEGSSANGLAAIDVTDPAAPFLLGHIDSPNNQPTRAVVAAGDYVYVANREDGLWIVGRGNF